MNVFYLIQCIATLVGLLGCTVQGGYVTRISPSKGSVRGATRITIYGQGFAENQFNFDEPTLGNNVTLVSTSGTQALPCDVIPYFTTRQQIVCTTRPSPFGYGSFYIRVLVDGSLLSNVKAATYCNGECNFQYDDSVTPSITDISPRYGLPGALITIRGRIYTDQYIETERTNTDQPTILRIFSGSSLCDPIDEGTKKLYGTALDRPGAYIGYIKCKPSSLKIGSQRVSFIISGYGRSLLSNDVIQVDAQGRLYGFQSHADIKSVTPSTGSTAGGTFVNITGIGFQTNSTLVTIGGIPCNILSITSSLIKCQVSHGFKTPAIYYPGNRGLLREVWTSTKVTDLSSIGNLNSKSRDYHYEVVPDASSRLLKPSFGEKKWFSSRLRGFFVAPSDNTYTFYIQADDKADLYLSLNSSASSKKKIASCPAATNTWNTYPQQQSAAFQLKAGHAYYLEAYHLQGMGSISLRIGVKYDKTKYVNSQIKSAVNEKQIIKVTSQRSSDVQIINITNWESGLVYDMQRVSVNTNSSGLFQLSYNGHPTIVLQVNATADDVKAALNSLQPIKQQGNVTVTQDSFNGTVNYNVTFLFALPDKTKLLKSNNGCNVTVTQVQNGKNGNFAFRFSLAQRTSDYIRVDASSDDVKSALQDMLSWNCSYQVPIARAWYYNGFEASAQGPEFGERVVDEVPYCGRTSLKNPLYIFYAGQSRDMGGRVMTGIDVSRYRQLCFAYKGAIKPFLSFLVSYTDQSENTVRSWRNYAFTPVTMTTTWDYQCFGIHDNVYSDKYISTRANKDYGYSIDAIKVARAGDVYIDDVIIWRDAVRVQRQQPAANPGNHVIESFDVKKIGSAVWAISMMPAHCGTNIDMINIVDAVQTDNNDDFITYRPVNQTSTVTVTRDQKATPPIGGTFELTFEGRTLSGLSSSVAAEDMKTAMQDSLSIGQVAVDRTGSCAGHQWAIEWTTTGGKQPQLQINGSNLSGNDVNATVETVDKGGMFLRPIPGDMLRVAEPTPQVTVMVNGIPSSCSHRNCSFTFKQSITLTSITPTHGTAGSTITLTGSGFSTQCHDNSVLIGGSLCHVTGCTSTTINCIAGQFEGGINIVALQVKDIGFAQHVNGEVTFKQDISIKTIKPTKGSTVGGTHVTIIGNGFARNKSYINVTIGGSQCIVTNTTLSQVTCITPKSSSIQADIKVQVHDEIGVLPLAYSYDTGLDTTPVIAKIGPSLTQSVGGGGFLEITAKQTWKLETTVTIGSSACNITQYYNTLIRCTIPPLQPGKYDVMVHVPGKGYASYLGSLPVMESVLEIIDIYPHQGSLFGGTIVTIRGRGFSDKPDNHVIKFDDVACDVVSSQSNQIVCMTRECSSTHVIDNSGVHPEYGIGYAWNPSTLTIHAGDIVKWEWASPQMTNLMYSVYRTNDSTSTVYTGKGFRSTRSSSGQFSHKFNVPGNYYYSSGPVDPYGVLTMKGKLIVLQPIPKTAQVSLNIGQFTASYQPKRPVPPLPSTANCQNGILSPCKSQIPNNTGYVFWECNTPVVTSIYPNVGPSSTVMTIRGKGLGPKPCYSEVLIGSQRCMVESSTSDVITCIVPAGLTAGIPYNITVRVNNNGYAWIQSDDVMAFTLLPTVVSLSPRAGSLAGGTLLTIFGNGFSLKPEEVTVSNGPSKCTVTSSTITQIQCYTQSRNTPVISNVTVTVNGLQTPPSDHTTFTYSSTLTPRIDYVTPTNPIGPSNIISVYGTGFPLKASDVTVVIGNSTCDVTSLTRYSLRCRIGPLTAGVHNISIVIHPTGRAMFGIDASRSVNSLALVSNISPSEGSVYGGTTVTVTGNGFDSRPGQTTIQIGLYECVIQRVTNSNITCITSRHTAGSHQVQIVSSGHVFPGLRYAYRSYLTPRISSLSPSKGTKDQTLTITGRDFEYDINKVTVTIGNSTCVIQSLTVSRIKCTLGGNPAGVYDVTVHVKGRGFAGPVTAKPIRFKYDIKIDSVFPKDCGFGGGRIVSIQGKSFSNATLVKVCNNPCHITSVTQSNIQCELPAYPSKSTTDVTCTLTIHGPDNIKASKPGYLTYRLAMTSTINRIDPIRGGTGGGTLLTIFGNGFNSVANGNKVSIAGVTCKVTSFSTTQIKCITGQRRGTIHSKVRVEVGDNGIATQDHADFEFIDVWSSRLSWGGNSPPIKGDLVVIPRGQTMLLDTSTPVFAALVIKGKVKFDEKDLVFNAEKILIVDGGVLEVGTEKQPFQHKAKIVLHGNLRSIELPLFGAKVLAVREGTLDLHGLHVPITWTRLENTAAVGASQLTLTQSVTWNVGDDIILTSTSRSPEENEQLTITSISSDGRTIGIKPTLKYKHVAIVQQIAGKTIQTRAEVGLLTRNVVVEGSMQQQWSDEHFRECPDDFDPDQFATQTCFVGRYGDEKNSDQFGSQIMLNAKEMNKGLVTGRISYIEVRHAGQAFKLGRYPIHFHMSGDVTGSYVRGCSIHHTFNRAVTIHGVQGLMVEHNVAYHVMGHGYFIEDGIETGNTIQYNLGVFVTSSSSLLNVDVTPGTFWITNPNNTVRHNAAAGGSHFGFWYNLPVHPGGPSYTPTVWPRTLPLGEFYNNTAHSFGRYGLWLFPTYIPRNSPALFQDFTAYNNLKGFEITEVGQVECVNCTMLDNKEAGFEVTIVQGSWNKGTTIRDSLVVGYSAISDHNSSHCTQGGVVGPHTSLLTLSGVTFVNFDAVKCAALRGCSFCRPFQGGWTVRVKGLTFNRSPNKAAFLWQHETVYKDLDGSLTGHVGGSIVATNENLPPQHCSQSLSASIGRVPGSVCDSIPQFRRISWNKPRPTSLLYKDALLSNQYGTNHVPWAAKRVTHRDGWMATLILGHRYNLTFENAQHLSNISYRAGFYEFESRDYVWVTHPMKHTPDVIKTKNKAVNMSSGLPQPYHASTGDWFYNNATNEMTYIVMGETGSRVQDITLQVVRCYYKSCIKPIPPPPPEKRPLQYLIWSDPESWYGTQPGYGGYNKILPTDGDDVMIRPDWWMVADVKLPSFNTLIIYGTLELETSMDFVLNATYIYIAPDANLIMGWPDQPMIGHVTVSLQGDWNTPDMMMHGAPNMGAKAIGVFGNLEIHGRNHTVYWTRLDRNAEIGARQIRVVDEVDWSEGDLIVIAPTTYRPHETEVVQIVRLSSDRQTIFINESLRYKHISWSDTIGSHNITMAAEIGLLTRNIVIEGADDGNGVLDKQLFGCRVLVGSVKGHQDAKLRRVRIENVEFQHCGQEGWSDYYDPRYSLSFLDIPSLDSSYVRGSSFHHGYNTGIGVFGVSGLVIQDNVIHRTVGSAVRVQGSGHYLVHNLVVQSLSPATFNGRHEPMNLLWHAAFELNNADDVILRNNAAAGSERIGFHIRGESCFTAGLSHSWLNNVAHTCLHGVHIGYNDGYHACAKVANFLSWKNWDYGIFAYPRSSVMVENSIMVDNKAGVLINVYAPPALSHHAADKFVQLDNVVIIGTSPSFDCTVDSKPPINAFNTMKSRGPRVKGGGHIGFVMTSFTSGPGMAPQFPWHMISNYPAINGITRINSAWFSGFGNKCGRQSTAIMTNPLSPDAMHPTEIRDLHVHSMDRTNLVYLEPPNVKWVNPSDCVDMDCDGHKEILIEDIDGSLTGSVGGSVISKAEYEWNGDPRRGLGDYRIPKAMLTDNDGSKLNVSLFAPHHGIVRGSRQQSFCNWNADWNAYTCTSINYAMMVIESLDADTEVRRVSPIALSADGYINLVNGPQDHGWCFGYTCQERISTFYAIVATKTNYTMYFTGTNPEKLRLCLINSDSRQSLRFAIWYSKPQRLDVYSQGLYVFPTNANIKASGFTLKKKDPSHPSDQFEPPLSSISGSNYFDRESRLLYVVVRGGLPVDIRTMPIIQLTIGTKPVHVNDFFEKNLLVNLASLLNIDKSRIRIVEIINGAGQSRKRRAISRDMKIRLEISSPPPLRIPFEPEETLNNTRPSSKPTPPPYPDTASYSQLKQLATKIVEKAQTKRMSSALKLEVLSIDVVDPEPPRKDPTGGVRATNGTGGSSNGTWRYDQKMTWQEGNKTSIENNYLIPVKLAVVQEPSDANETVPFGVQPKLVLLDVLNNTVKTLGHSQQWILTVSIRPGTGSRDASLNGNTSIVFIDGWANFTNLHITHSYHDYILDYSVTSPSEANIKAFSEPFNVSERVLYFTLVSTPHDSNETVPFVTQPVVIVRDLANGERVTNTGWKGRKWLCHAVLRNASKNTGQLQGLNTVQFEEGMARFTNLSIDYAGRGYILTINAFTIPASPYIFTTDSPSFNVRERNLQLVIVQQPGDCNDTVICGYQPIVEIQDKATKKPVTNIGWRDRVWTVDMNILGNATVLSRVTIPKSGKIVFTGLKFYDIARNVRLQFTVNTSPPSPRYSNMTAVSDCFDVRPRMFYLAIVQQPGLANASEIFGQQPIIEVRDIGSRVRATPLKSTWNVTVSMFYNPKPGKSVLKGHVLVPVYQERALFTDLLISEYGQYKLSFTSNYGHSVLSKRFQVRYVNDYSPQFIPNNATRTVVVSESSPIGTSIVAFSAVDRDQGSQGHVQYSIASGNIGNALQIDNTSGIVTTRTKLDRETTSTYSLTIRASDKAVPGKVRFSEVKVVVMVIDVNDNAPVFVTKPLEVDVNETTLVGHVIVRVTANDSDEGTNGQVQYSIINGNTKGFFTINKNTGDVTLEKTLDLETQPRPPQRFTVGIQATDLGKPTSLNSTSTLTVIVKPINEFAPEFTQKTLQTFNLKENVKVGGGLVLVDVNATDKDYGSQGQVSYSIVSGNQQGCFVINNTTGVVLLVKSLDYELSRDYNLVIRAFDSGSAVLHANITMVINVIDVNDNKPLFAADMNHVLVNETTVIGETAFIVKATDADSGSNGRLSYSIQTGNEDDFFSIIPDTGELKLLKTLDLDVLHDMDWNRTLVITASDHGIPQLSSNSSFVVRVHSVNEYNPVFTSKSLSLRLDENITIGIVIATVSASDSDYGPDGQIRYAITTGNNEHKFRIDPVLGHVIPNAPLDYEHTSSLHLQVEARDNPTNPANQRRALCQVDVALVDVNDNKPIFSEMTYYAKIRETSSIGHDVIWAHASDRDSGTNGEITYSITAGNELGYFTIDSYSGTISTQRDLDLETQQHVNDLIYILHVNATDKGSPSLSNTVVVTIEIISVNEFIPQLHQPESVYVRINETTSSGSRVWVVKATDKDFGIDGFLTYAIASGNDNDTFTIDKNTGVITLSKPLDYQSLPRYFLVVMVTDGTPFHVRHSVVAKVTIRLINSQDSGGSDIRILGDPYRITCSGNVAEDVGINTSSYFNIELLEQDGTKSRVLNVNDNRVTLDDQSLSHGLFAVAKGNNKWIIQVSKHCGHGDGILIVRVQGVYSLHFLVSVVTIDSLVLQVKSEQRKNPDETYTDIATFYRLGNANANFEQADLSLYLKLTDNTLHDVTDSTITSFNTTTNDVNVKVKLKERRMIIDRMTSYGQFSVYGMYKNMTSSIATLSVVNKFVIPKEVKSVAIRGLVNDTLLGVAGRTSRRLVVTMVMDDMSIISVDDFDVFSSLVKLSCKQCRGASIDSSGVVTLVKDSWSAEQIVATNSYMNTDYQSIDFYCNTQPRVGGVDIGYPTGPAITNYGDPVPIYINTTGFTLLAYNITITNSDPTVLIFQNIKNNIPYGVTDRGSYVTLANVIGAGDSDHHGYVTDMLFSVFEEEPGVRLLGVESSTVIDNQMKMYSSDKGSECSGPSIVLGDVDQCGDLNVYDAALVMMCARNNKCPSNHKETMDFNKNGLIEESDAVLLLRAALNQVRFIEYLEVTTPNHRRSKNCVFAIRTSLVMKDNTTVTKHDTQVFFELASQQPIIQSQLKKTLFKKGKLIHLYDGRDGLWGGIVQLQYSKDGTFELESSESQLEVQGLGISMIQVTHNLNGVPASVTPLFSSSSEPRYRSAVNVTLANNIRFLATDGHSPQLLFDIESTASCVDPFITKTINITFENDFATIATRQEEFKKTLRADLLVRYPDVSITMVTVAPGSIRVGFKATAKAAILESFIESLWRLLQAGYELTFDDVTFVATKTLLVDGSRKLETTPVTSFPVTMVVSICIAMVTLFVLVGILVYFRHRFHGYNRWLKVKKMTRMASSASLHQFENPAQEQEMTFICNQPEVYQNIPGTPNTANKPYRPSSAMSSDSVEAWAEDSHMTPPTRQTKRLGSGKVSPAPVPSVHKTVSKQNSTSRLIDNDTDSGTSTPEEHEIKVPTMTFNVAKALMNHEDATTYRKRPHSRDELKRQSSDSKLLNTDEGRGSPFTKPKLHKRMTWATNSLPVSADSSPPYSGSTTPNSDRRAVTPSNVMTSLRDDLKIQDEPFTLRLPVNILNMSRDAKTGPFTKLGFIEVQSDSTLTELRHSMTSHFDIKHFVFEDAHMNDVSPSDEDVVTVEDMFTLSVIIKVITQQDEINRLFCICDKVAWFQCSLCYRQGYCGRDCQSKDWAEHTKHCNHDNVSEV